MASINSKPATTTKKKNLRTNGTGLNKPVHHRQGAAHMLEKPTFSSSSGRPTSTRFFRERALLPVPPSPPLSPSSLLLLLPLLSSSNSHRVERRALASPRGDLYLHRPPTRHATPRDTTRHHATPRDTTRHHATTRKRGGGGAQTGFERVQKALVACRNSDQECF